MTFRTFMKPILASSLAAVLLVGGASAAFADKGKGEGNGKHHGQGNVTVDGNIQIIMNFDDVSGDDVEWAAKSIASLASKRVFVGYEDGTFQPRKAISRIEAITAAVRLMGLGDKAQTSAEMNANLNFKDADKIKKQYPWAVGYVAVAVENDLFQESDSLVQPEKAADRLWATTLLVKAMKLTADAKAQMNVKLPFKDADQIPAGSVGYVAVAVNKGLIAGYEDNTFRPNRAVTRAELAALLDRTEQQLPEKDNTLVTGSLSAAVTNNVLLLNKAGTITSVAVNPNAFVFRSGKLVTLVDLLVGDELKVRTYNNVAIFIEVTKPVSTTPTPTPTDTSFTVYGVYKGMTLSADGKIATIKLTQNINNVQQDSEYRVASNVVITGTLPADGKVLELKGSNALVTQIKVF